MNTRSATHRPWLARYSACALLATLFLLYAGGFTTTIGAGMVFPDWPLSNGSLNPEGWMQDQAMAAEHSHRLLGMVVGNLTLALAIWIWFVDSRVWMRKLGMTALILVIIQGILGGVRVLENEVNYAIIHGCLGQIFFCVLTAIAIGQTKVWHELREIRTQEKTPSRSLGVFLISLVFLQLIVAAIMRHKGAGLAIPTFPLNPDGTLLPQAWPFAVSIHFAHRALAAVLCMAYLFWIIDLIRNSGHAYIQRIGMLSCFLLCVQIALGASAIWMARDPLITTLHVLNSAFLLAATWATHFFCYHRKLEFPEEHQTCEPQSTQAHDTPRTVNP